MRDLHNDSLRGVSPLGAGVFMDNLSIGMALSLFDPQRETLELRRDDISLTREEIKQYYPEHTSSLGMWVHFHYSWQDAALEIASLASLLENLVISEKIYVDEPFADYWITRQIPESDWLRKIVLPIGLAKSDRKILVRRAADRVRKHLEADPVSDDLSSWPPPHGYERQYDDKGLELGLGLGLASPVVLTYPDNLLSDWGTLAASELDMNFSEGQLRLFNVDCSDLIEVLRQRLGYWGDKYWNIVAPQQHRPEDIRKKAYLVGGGDIAHALLLDLGGMFYDEMARAFGRPYCPHVSRALYVRLDHAHHNTTPALAAKLALQYAEQARQPMANKANLFAKNALFDLHIPAILAAVLKQVDSPTKILTIAKQMRETEEARTFRGWAHNLDELMAEGDITKISTAIEELQKLADQLARRLEEKQSTIALQVGVSPIVIEMEVPIPPALAAIARRRKKHLVFLYELYNKIMSIGRMESEICRVFGKLSKACQAAKSSKIPLT